MKFQLTKGELFSDSEKELKWLRRMCKHNTIFRVLKDKTKAWHIIYYPLDYRIKNHLKRLFGEVEFGNDSIKMEGNQ